MLECKTLPQLPMEVEGLYIKDLTPAALLADVQSPSAYVAH